LHYAIRLAQPRSLPADPRDLCPNGVRELLPAGDLRAVYFGSEFCEDLLPDLAEAELLCQWAEETGLEAVLLTPMVRPGGLDRLKQLLDGLPGRGRRAAVVFSDWGVFRLLRTEYPHLECRAGRLLNRALRDPRLAGQAIRSHPQEASRGEQLRSFLTRSGVAGLETDPDLEGSYLGPAGENLQRVLHLPYTFVASGRNCLFKAETKKTGKNFTQWLGSECQAPCREQWHKVPREDLAFPLWRAGNTLFYEAPPGLIKAHLDRADRIVIHERPMP
jgi:hypothetical protein